jgi:hypothetical protein
MGIHLSKKKLMTQGQLPDWTGLLSWSTKFHDGTSRSQFSPLDPERREWLEKALNAAFGGGETPQKVMAKGIEEIAQGRTSAGLDLLDYASDFPDCAEDLDKRGALQPLVSLISSSDSRVVVRALEVLTLYLPNNPRVQLAAALKYEIVAKLKECIIQRPTDIAVIHSAVSVMGSTIRNVVSLENSFIKEGGCEFIIQLGSNLSDKAVVQKVCAIASSLSERHSLSEKSMMISLLLEKIYSSELFERCDIQFWEIVASLSKSFSRDERLSPLITQRLEWIGDQTDHAVERDILLSE